MEHIQMRWKTFSVWPLVLAAVFLTACSAIARRHPGLKGNHPSRPASVAQDTADPISGEWEVSFFVRESRTPATFTLKLDGTKVTGTAYSDHTGPGVVRDGKWADGKLSFILDFKKHIS